MSLFNSLKDDGLQQTEDRLGGGSYIKESGAYDAKIKVAYAGASDSGAMSVTAIFDIEGKEYRETFWLTKKTGENYFVKDGNKIPMTGYTMVNDICLLTTGFPLADQETEEKVVKLYDREASKELPKSVPVLTALTGMEVTLGIVKIHENKQEKDGKGEYVDIADERFVNEINKVFHTESKRTVVEFRESVEEAVFYGKWLEANKDKVRDKRTIKDGQGGKSGKPAPTAGSATTGATGSKSLFGNK